MRLKVVTQLAPSQDHGVEQLLDLWVLGLGFEQDFTDEVDWLLVRSACPSTFRSTTMAMLTTWLVVAMYSKRGSLSDGGTRIGALESSALSLSRAS
jgi:hypothetical protein